MIEKILLYFLNKVHPGDYHHYSYEETINGNKALLKDNNELFIFLSDARARIIKLESELKGNG